MSVSFYMRPRQTMDQVVYGGNGPAKMIRKLLHRPSSGGVQPSNFSDGILCQGTRGIAKHIAPLKPALANCCFLFWLNVFVGFPVEDQFDYLIRNAIASTEGLTRHSGRIFSMDDSNIRISQFRKGHVLTTDLRSVENSVCRILFARSPLDVFQPVIPWIAVGEVAALHSLWARSYEGFKDYDMDLRDSACACFAKLDEQIPPFVWMELQHAAGKKVRIGGASGKRTNPTEGRSFVNAFVFGNSFPDFRRMILHDPDSFIVGVVRTGWGVDSIPPVHHFTECRNCIQERMAA